MTDYIGRCPFANWRGTIPNETPGGAIAHRGLVLHVQQGMEAGTDAWFHNPAAQASAHFGVGTDGTLDQWVDIHDKSWAEAAGNPYWVSVEIAGYSGAPATGPQVATLARLYGWLASQFAWPFMSTDDPNNGTGLGWHGMGGAAWGGHYSCLPLDSTEVLTPNGWRLLGSIRRGDVVASYVTESGMVEFGPGVPVPRYNGDTMTIAGFEMTADHRLVVHRTDVACPSKVLTALEVATVRTNWVIPASGQLETTGCGVGADLMRLLVWVQADARYNRSNSGRVEALDWHLRKDRKVRRIGEVLDQLGWDYTLNRQGNGSWRLRAYGMDRIERDVLRWLPEKKWGWWLLGADAAEFSAFDEEVCLADGSERSDMRTYNTTVEENADIVQALYVTHGRRTSKHIHPLPVHPLHNRSFGVQFAVSRNVYAVRDTAGTGRLGVAVGCVTTHNGTLLVRQKGRVAVVGNCPGEPIKGQRPAILAAAQGHVVNNTHGGTSEMMPSTDRKDGSLVLVDPSGAVFTFGPNGGPGGHYLGGLNNHPEWNAGDGRAEGAAVAVHHYDDGNPTHDAYVIITRDLPGHFHNYNFPSDGSLAK